MFFGIDVGGTKIQFAVGTEAGVQILKKIPTPSSYEAFIEGIACNFFETQAHFPIKTIRKVGVGIPGTFTEEKIIWVPNIPCLEGHDLVGDLQQILGVEVHLGNDAQLGLLGEMWKGAGKGYTNAVLMSIGTGIGGAIMVSGRLIRGKRGAAGALGWLNLDAFQAPDPNHGYLENHASGKALEKIALSLTPPLTSFKLVEKARLGDPQCATVMAHFGHLIGVSLASIASVLDTELVILSGGLSEEIDAFRDSLEISFCQHSAPGVEKIPIVTSQLGNLAGVYGAVRLAEIQGDLWI